MNTIIENINALMGVKSDLNVVLKDHGIDGGPVFDEYPDKFRELFRILESAIDDIGEGPYTNYEPITNVVKPVISYKDNVVFITCATPGAQIYFRRDYEGWGQYILNFYITHDTFVESYAILNGVRSSTVSLLVPYIRPDEVDPPVISRVNGLVTIMHPDENATIWYRIYPNAYVQYEGPVNIDDSYTIVAYASLTGMASEEVWSEGSGEPTVVADPIISCSQNIVTMTCATEGATIWYKTGTSTEWHQYVNPITISADTLFTAYAYKNGSSSSQITYTAQYDGGIEPPVVVPADPIFSVNEDVVTITCSTEGTTIYWREYGDIEWIEYTESIIITEDTVFEAYAELNGISSNTVTFATNYGALNELPLSFKILENGTVKLSAGFTLSGNYIDYQVNDNEWESIYIFPIDGYHEYNISVLRGDIVRFKGGNNKYNKDRRINIQFSTTCNFEIFGNIMSLVNEEEFSTLTAVNKEIIFASLFQDCTKLISAELMVLPCTSLTAATSCYYEMFSGCTSLKYSPKKLPATALASQCYWDMFFGCTSLITTPELPATTLINKTECYGRMFCGCTSLTTAPELPATTLANGCYSSMFSGCTSLTTAPELPATTLAQDCYSSMFRGCTSLTTAPDLLARWYRTDCYSWMFDGCTNLNYIKCLLFPYNNTACGGQGGSWVNGVAATGTFIKDERSTWPTGTNGIPEGWTVQSI